MSDPQSQRIVVQCSCGAKLKVPAEAAGRKGRCPKCQDTFTIQPPAPKPAEPAEVSDESGHSLLDELAAQERSASTTQAGKGAIACPECHEPMPTGAALCRHCGYNLETGKVARQPSATTAAASAAASRLARGAGTLFLGCALSGVGALVGAAIWSVVGVITEYEIGWIACGLGFLAGGGMVLGYRSHSPAAGLLASLIAIVGIIAAKAFMFGYINYPELRAARESVSSLNTENLAKYSRLAYHRTELETKRKGMSETDERWEIIHDRHLDEVWALSPEDLDREVATLEAWEAGGRNGTTPITSATT